MNALLLSMDGWGVPATASWQTLEQHGSLRPHSSNSQLVTPLGRTRGGSEEARVKWEPNGQVFPTEIQSHAWWPVANTAWDGKKWARIDRTFFSLLKREQNLPPQAGPQKLFPPAPGGLRFLSVTVTEGSGKCAPTSFYFFFLATCLFTQFVDPMPRTFWVRQED